MTHVAFPMRPGMTLNVTPIELMKALKRDRAALVRSKLFRNFLPCFAPLALLTNEVNKGFNPTVKGPSTALPGSLRFVRVAHGTVEYFFGQCTAPNGDSVSEQWES
jgi:hypothetical protein